MLAGAGSVVAVGSGAVSYRRYARRHHLRFRPLLAVNESDQPVRVAVIVASDPRSGPEETYDLEASGDADGGDELSIGGPWLKTADVYGIRAATVVDELVLENRELNEALGAAAGWGADCAAVTLTVTDDRRLDASIQPSERC